jgi:hypothetical protein
MLTVYCACVSQVDQQAAVSTQVEQEAAARPEQPDQEKPADQTETPDQTREAEQPADSAQPTPEAAAAAQDDEGSGPAYTLALKPQVGDTTYFRIENTFRDSGGGPPLLTYVTSIEDRRFITQRVLEPATEQAPSQTKPPRASLSWECDRYDVRERGMKDDVSFDSLRHLYPPPTLRILGGIPGSVSTFEIDPRTGTASQVRTKLGEIKGPQGREKLSRTAGKCQLSAANLKELLNDLGPFWLPTSPVRVGDQWTKTHRESHRNLGTVITDVTCTLRSVREVDDSRIASIDLTSDIRLEQNSDSGTTSAHARKPRSKPSKQHDYKLNKKDCVGTIEFDITHGELVRMTLHRELEFVAKITSAKASQMINELRKGEVHDLRVEVSRVPPRQPLNLGGLKPPVIPESARPKAASKPKPKPKERRAATTQPGSRFAERHPSSQPSGVKDRRLRQPSTRPANNARHRRAAQRRSASDAKQTRTRRAATSKKDKPPAAGRGKRRSPPATKKPAAKPYDSKRTADES